MALITGNKLVDSDFLVEELALNSFQWFKTTMNSGGPVIYENFVRRGIIQRNEEYIKTNIDLAIEIKKNTLKLISGLEEKDYQRHFVVINCAKALCVDDFFMSLKSKGIELKNYLREFKEKS